MNMKHDQVGIHQGLPFYKDEEGYYWQNGGYFETEDEVKADIADFNRGNADAPENFHEDTPCLPEPWWRTER